MNASGLIRTRRTVVGVLLATALIAPALPTAGAADLVATGQNVAPAPGTVIDNGAARQIPDQWIVEFEPLVGTAAVGTALRDALDAGAEIRQRFSTVLNGAAVVMPEAMAQALRAHPFVRSVEPDYEVHTMGTQSPTPSWGLDRIDQTSLPLNNSFSYGATGAAVSAYVLDTGIRASHNDFGGRVVAGYTAINDGYGTSDCNGHGTHVAGTIGGTKYGVAKAVTLVPVRVLDCSGSGSNSGVIAGLDWVVSRHQTHGGPSVVNMSLGGGPSSSLDTAVNRAITAGISVAVAAGNDNTDACGQSPARVPAAVTVGASTSADGRASFSNYGSCLDLFAPGQAIVSDLHSSDTATATFSGTSMASPHVAGVIAGYLQGAPTATPAQVRSALVDNSILGLLSGLLGSANRLLRTVIGSSTPTPTPSPTPTPTPTPAPTSTPAPAPPGQAPVVAASSLTLRTGESRVRYGDSVTLSGVLRNASTGQGLAGRSITLLATDPRTGRSLPAGDLVTGAGGSYALTIRPAKTYRYAVRFVGEAAHNPAISAQVTVKVQATVKARATKKRGRVGSYFTIVGSANPVQAKATLVLQWRSNGAWRTVAKRQTGTNGVVTFQVKLTAKRTYTFRVHRPSGGGVGSASSHVVKVRAR